MRTLPLTLATLAIAMTACAQVKRPVPGYRPWVEKILLARCDSVVVGRIGNVSSLPNNDRLIRVDVQTVISGTEGDDLLVVGSDDAILRFRKLPKLLFLKRSERGSMRLMLDFVDLPDDDRGARVDFLKRVVSTRKPPRGMSREVMMKRAILEHLATRSNWVRRVVAREVVELSRHRAALFRGDDLLQLLKFDVRALPARDKGLYRSAIVAIEEANAVGWTGDRLVFPDDASRKSFLESMAVFQRSQDSAARIDFLEQALKTFGRRVAPVLALAAKDKDDEVRRRGAFLLGETEAGSGLRVLLAMLDSRDVEDARVAAVALGKIASADAVAALLRAAVREPVRKEALTALAATNTGEAALYLKDLEEELLDDPKSSPDLRWHVSYIRSPRFRTDLATQQAERRKRFRRP